MIWSTFISKIEMMPCTNGLPMESLSSSGAAPAEPPLSALKPSIAAVASSPSSGRVRSTRAERDGADHEADAYGPSSVDSIVGFVVESISATIERTPCVTNGRCRHFVFEEIKKKTRTNRFASEAGRVLLRRRPACLG